MNRNRLTSILINTLLFAASISIIYGYALAFWPIQIVDYHQAFLATPKDEYSAGEQLFAHFDLCKKGTYTATIYPELVGDSIVPMEPFTSQVAPGCYDTDAAVGYIPLHTPAGMYKLRLITRYRVNAFKIVTYSIESTAFSVDESKLIYL